MASHRSAFARPIGGEGIPMLSAESQALGARLKFLPSAIGADAYSLA